MTRSEFDARFKFALDVCRQAGEIARSGFRSATGITVTEKGRHDLVTSADLQVDALFRVAVRDAFPQDAVLTEESLGEVSTALWVIDPIDGTQNFARGIAHFAISLAFVRDGEVQFGIVYNPVSEELFSARKGQGAYLNGKAIRVSAVTDPEKAVVDIGYAARQPRACYLGLLDGVLSAGFSFLQQGSAALGLAQVACGRLEGYAELDLFSWDVLAGLILIEEAGGWTMPFPADRDLAIGRPVLACAPAFQQIMSSQSAPYFA